MNDWVGLAFIAALIAAAYFGLRQLAKPTTRTPEEFERNAADGPTMLGASISALQEMMNPEEAKAKETITQMKEGRFQKKRKEGKASGEANAND